jgi:DNA-binding PadR family transcriptional regulator
VSIRHALLALLSDGPKYGLQLRHEFEARTGEVWPLNVGQVYTTLQRLERDGLVESDETEDSPQKGFQITASGEHELQAWLRTPSDGAPPRDELVIKVMVALAVPGVDVRDLVQVHRRHLVELMQSYTRLKESATDGELALALVVDAEIYRIDGTIRWLDSVEARLKRAEGSPAAAASGVPAAPALARRTRRLGVRA